MKYRKELDGVRALAILGVLVGHTVLFWAPNKPGLGGGLGVNLFFVLSGYLITTLLLNERSNTGTVDRARFYGRRALRLGPALILAIVLGWVVSHYAGQHGPGVMPYGRSAIAAFFFAGNWFKDRLGLLGHTWSLGVEEQYYLVWPSILILALAASVRRRALIVLLLVGAACVLVVRSEVHHGLRLAETGIVLAFEQTDGVLLGSALALALVGDGRFVRALDKRWLAVAAALVGGVFVFRFPWGSPEILILINICFVLLIGHVVRDPEGPIASVLRVRPLPAIGRISYGLYLYHWILFSWAREVVHGPVLAATAAWTLSFGAAIVSFVAVERPVLTYKDRLRPKERNEAQSSVDVDRQDANERRTHKQQRT